MSTSSGQKTAAASTSSSDNLSNVLGSIGSTTDSSASATNSNSNSASTSASGSGSGSGSGSASATGSNTITDAPSLSTGSVSSLSGAPSLTSGDIPHLTDLPTLSGFYSYPPPSVPPTQNAPYMEKTSLPENFVFIIVGAVITFVACVIIGWRIMTSWSINRRFRHFEGSTFAGAGKTSYTPLAEFKNGNTIKAPVSSSHDMKDLSSLPKNFSTVPSLFYSPTAEVARNSMRPPSSRIDSSHGHLPAGHYRDASRS